MSGENIVVWGTQKTLESNGASIANNALVVALGTYNVEVDGQGFPDGEFALTVSYAVAPTEGALLTLHARPLDVDGTLDSDVPEAARPSVFLGGFQVDNRTGLQTLVLTPLGFARDLPRNAEYYLYNNGTGQAVQAGWVLKITPRTNKAA